MAPKKAPFCKNLFLCHFPVFFSIVIQEQPILFLPKRWVVLESQADRDKWHGIAFWALSSCLCLCPRARSGCAQPGTETAKTTTSWGRKGLLMPTKKICKTWIPYKMTIKINRVIPYKMNGPNPAKFSNCILRLLYDSDFMPKSSILFFL